MIKNHHYSNNIYNESSFKSKSPNNHQHQQQQQQPNSHSKSHNSSYYHNHLQTPLNHHSPPSSSSPHHLMMEKDEQLQLCIQRFVSDAQTMMNQFQEMFIGEVRRFADVCIEFSLAYRTVLEDRDFISVENSSLKDELDVRTGQLEMISKELRETREENEELIRRLECIGVSDVRNGISRTLGVYSSTVCGSTGSPILGNSIRILDPVAMSRHIAV